LIGLVAQRGRCEAAGAGERSSKTLCKLAAGEGRPTGTVEPIDHPYSGCDVYSCNSMWCVINVETLVVNDASLCRVANKQYNMTIYTNAI